MNQDPDQAHKPKRKKSQKFDHFAQFVSNARSSAGPLSGPAPAPNLPLATQSGLSESGLAPKPGKPHYLEKLLHEKTGGDPEKLKELLENIEEAVNCIVKRGSPLTRLHYASAKSSFEVLVKLLSAAVGQPAKDPWV
ncbi:hypothetical protein FRC07_008076 [Ceratobasidium sp. 392]|nr:hypothetical protein FRC07_008076 [Ceratobasidium sp. 392]